MIHYKTFLIPTFLSFFIFGCSSMGMSDGSLDYQKPNRLPPLQMGDEDNSLINPIFPLPPLNNSANENTFKPSGSEFELPRPSTDN